MKPNPLHVDLCYLLVSTCYVPAQGLMFSPPITFLQPRELPLAFLECSSASNNKLSHFHLFRPWPWRALPGRRVLGTVPLSQQFCPWVPGSNHFKGHDKLLQLLSSFSLPLWFSVPISDDLKRQFYLCLLRPTRLPESVCSNVSPHLQTSRPLSLPSSWGSGLSLSDVCWSFFPLLSPPCYPVLQ